MTDVAAASSPAPSQVLPFVVIEPKGEIEWRELWRYRDLFRILAERDIRLRYRQTALGVVWVILQPLAASLIFATIFGLFAKLPSDGVPYLPFVFTAMLPWNLLAGGIQRGGNSLLGNTGLITKIYFPRLIIPIASVAAVLLDFAVAAVVMLGLILIYGIPITWSILALPFLVFLTLAATIGVSLLFSALSVYYRDFSYALPFALQIWLYGSPVVYASTLIPDQWQLLYGLNPMVGVINGFRWVLLGAPLQTATLLESVLVSFLIMVIGAAVFRRVERSFADVI